MDAHDDQQQALAALRVLLERAGEQAAKLSAIVRRALECEAFDPECGRGCSGLFELSSLTPRERDVLALVLDGRSSKEIARGLGISRATARCHVQNILTKLGVYSRAQAAAAVPRAGSAPRAGAAARLASLTPREAEVLRALAAGMEKREIAAHFVLSPHTVRTHIQRVLAKLGVHSVLGAMAVARDAGLAPLPR